MKTRQQQRDDALDLAAIIVALLFVPVLVRVYAGPQAAMIASVVCGVLMGAVAVLGYDVLRKGRR